MKIPVHLRAIVALVICALLWSSGGLLIKTLPLSPLTIAGARSAIAALVIFAWQRNVRPTWSKAQIGSIVSYMLTVILFVMATKNTTAANAILLQYTAPIWVGLFSVFVTKEKPTRIDILAVIVVMSGMTIFFLDAISPGAMLGNTLAVLSGIAFAGVALFMRAQKGESTTESILFGNILTALVCMPFIEPFAGDADTLVRLGILGVFQLGLSYVLYAWAIKTVTALEAVLITVLEPLLNPLWVGLFYGEIPSGTSIVGGVIVVAAVVTRNFVHASTLQRASHSRPHR
ncbi:MAG: EamA family transporter [Ignavibacteria bacterium]|nr:EamA family transporter [Ignavibacteria bacterium]MBK9183815.1 EamA family transporter [Ignavibacteria bacterium]